MRQHLVLLFYLAGLLGMLGHYTKKWARGQYAGNLWAYLIADNPRASLASVITYLAATTGVVATGTLDTMDFATALGLGFVTGYTVDSAVNSTSRS